MQTRAIHTHIHTHTRGYSSKLVRQDHLKELHVILACDEDHKKVFPKVPIIGLKNNKNLKSYLVKAGLPYINEVGRCELAMEKDSLVKEAVI